MKSPFILLKLGFLIYSAASLAAPAFGQSRSGPDPNVQRIAAVVNDGVISEYDLEQRLSLAITTMGVTNSDRTRNQLRPRVLNNLINEKLQTQEAREQEIEIELEQVDETIEAISRQNDRTLPEFVQMLEDDGITLKTLAEQVSADLLWRKLVRQSFIPRISDDEIERIITQREASKGEMEYDLAEIVVTVEKADGRPAALKSANRLLSQLRRGAQFPVVARQFSEGSTAANGGEIGWTQLEQLPKELAKEVAEMSTGEVSAPLYANGAYYIMLLKEERQILGPDLTLTELHLKQIFFDLPEDSSESRQQEVRDLADIVRTSINGCSDIDTLVGEGGASRTVDLGRVMLGELPAQVRAVVADLEVGIPSDAIRTPTEVLLMVVCDRKEPPNQAPTKNSIAQRLHERRMAMMARRYLRDLHRDAIIDVR